LPRARGASCFRYNSKTRRGVARARRKGGDRNAGDSSPLLFHDTRSARYGTTSGIDPRRCETATPTAHREILPRIRPSTTTLPTLIRHAFFFSFFFLSSAMREFHVDRASDPASKEVGSNVIRAGRCFLETQRRFYRRYYDVCTNRVTGRSA